MLILPVVVFGSICIALVVVLICVFGILHDIGLIPPALLIGCHPEAIPLSLGHRLKEPEKYFYKQKYKRDSKVLKYHEGDEPCYYSDYSEKKQ